MKIRNGFVSNSSSTSFTFVFKGDKIDDLSALIWKYRGHFSLSYDASWNDTNDCVETCNAQDVVEAIEKCAKDKNDKWNAVKIVSIDDSINQFVDSIKEYDQMIKDKEDKCSMTLRDFYKQYKREAEEVIDKLNMAKKKGLTSVFVIGFGDNHGQISGGGLGTVMDYEGRDIDIDEKDFVVFTEQNR